MHRPETYSVVVNNVNVQELLFALARDAKINVDINRGITGSVTLNAIDQTLPQLLSRIANQVDMRWELQGPNLIVMPDSPYLRLYRIDYVNMERTAIGTVGVSSQITGAATGGAGGGAGAGAGAAANASTTRVTNSSVNDFWKTLVQNVKDILRETDRITPASVAPVPSPVPAPAQPGQAAAPAPVAPPAPAVTFQEAGSVIANPEAGVLTVRATSRQHEKIQEFLDRVMANAKRQVLIEATIVEVQLNNQYQQGIDWSIVRRGSTGLNLLAGSTAPNTALPSGVSTSVFTAQANFGQLSATLKLLESFGNVRVLSSPKLSVLNNQTAILKVVDEEVYFTIQANTVANQTSTQTTFTTTPNVVPVGFVMNVTPQVGDSDSILLNVRPSLSRILRRVTDPNPSLANPCGFGQPLCGVAPVISQIPVIQRREMESLIKVNSGQVAVMGGLIEDRLSDIEDGIPGLNRTPAASLFAQRNQLNSKTELVVFLRPMVVTDPSIDGDYRAFRSLVPGEDFMFRPNPGRPPIQPLSVPQ